MRFRHGMVVGKFYPPHAGHHHLIDVALDRCDRLTVVVAPSSTESIPLDQRCAWLREAHPRATVVGIYDDTPVDYDDEDIWDVHCRIFRTALDSDPIDSDPIDGGVIDAVFSSEAYGAELARRFDAEHVSVDPGRLSKPISGTAVRADPVGHWPHIGPGARAWFTRRVIAVGAESTGTTTITRALAEAFAARGGVWSSTQWIPEYGRELTERKLAAMPASATVFDVQWDRADFIAVATEQNRAEDAAARIGSPVLFGDTDAFATSIWEERYLGSASDAVRRLARRPDLYLLTGHAGIPFEDDGLRDGEHIREWMTGRFRDELPQLGVPVIELSGPHDARLADAISAVDALLDSGWHLAEPLG
ncbi:MAG TPA: AAA family ATPase [Micromonosporaceae bacterium]